MFARTQLLPTSLLLLVAASLFSGDVQAWQSQPQPQTNRRNFMGKLIAVSSAAAVVSSTGVDAGWAAEGYVQQQYRGRKGAAQGAFRGGSAMSSATHDGTDLNAAETNVAGGLLDKMGLSEVPGANARSQDRKQTPTGARQ